MDAHAKTKKINNKNNEKIKEDGQVRKLPKPF